MHSLKEYLYYMWKRSSERQSRKKFRKHFEDDFNRFEQSRNQKPPAQIKKEMKMLAHYWGCFPYQYYRYDLYDKACPFSIEEMMDFIPNFFAYNLFFPRSFMEYGILCEHKGITHAVMTGFGIPQPVMLLRFDAGTFYNHRNELISDDEANRIIQSSETKKIVIKPSFGLGGQGVLIYPRDPEKGYIDEEGRNIDAHFFHEQLKSGIFVVQQGLVQHPDIMKIYPHSVNTFRIITETENGKVKILFSLMRMGRGGKQVDNASAGGLYIKVNKVDGSFHDFAYCHNRIKFSKHPDTGFSFSGAKIAQWDQILVFLSGVALKFREIRYIGWDIALTESGPAVIEINNGPDIEILQDFYNGIRSHFGIVPEKWWYNSRFTVKEL